MDLSTAGIEPFVNAAYVNLDMDGFREKGGAAALRAGDQSADAAFTTLGLRAELPVALGEVTGRLRGMAGWRHAFGDSTPDTTLAFGGGGDFTVSGVPLAKDSAVLEAGFALDLGADASLDISYTGAFDADYADQGVRAGFKLSF